MQWCGKATISDMGPIKGLNALVSEALLRASKSQNYSDSYGHSLRPVAGVMTSMKFANKIPAPLGFKHACSSMDRFPKHEETHSGVTRFLQCRSIRPAEPDSPRIFKLT